MAATRQVTLQYSMFLKRALVESLQAAFAAYSDPTLANARIAVDFSKQSRWKAPGIIIEFNDTDISNAGIGHEEYLVDPQDPDPTNPTMFVKYHHRIYHGEVTFQIYGLSAVDRDIMRDALIEVITMTDTSTQGDNFINRFNNSMDSIPYGTWHFPVLNTDKLSGGGASPTLAPWMPEDTLVYQVTYSMPIVGEFYSVTPVLPSSTGLLQEVDVYPWIEGIDPTPQQNPFTTNNPDWYRFTGWTNTDTVI